MKDGSFDTLLGDDDIKFDALPIEDRPDAPSIDDSIETESETTTQYPGSPSSHDDSTLKRILSRMLFSCFPSPNSSYKNLASDIKGRPDLFGLILIPFLLIFGAGLSALLASLIFPHDYVYKTLDLALAFLVLPSYVIVFSLLMIIIPALGHDSSRPELLLASAMGCRSMEETDEFSQLSLREHCCIVGYSLSIYLPLPLLALIPIPLLRSVFFLLSGALHIWCLLRVYYPVPTVEHDPLPPTTRFSASDQLKRLATSLSIAVSTVALIFFFWFILFHYTDSGSDSPSGFDSLLALQQCSASKQFTIHGLWPIENTCCDGPSFSLQAISSLRSALLRDWPSCFGLMTDEELWEHEWDKHGTCTGLSQFEYFQKTLNLRQQFYSECTVSSCRICLSPEFTQQPLSKCPPPPDISNC